jgi:DnaK suppressor protein
MIDKIVLKTKIIATIAQAEIDMEGMKEATKPISPENSIGRISRMDAINNKGVAEAAMRATKRKLDTLRKALLKIEDPSFGKCSSCGRFIQEARLMYMPQSTECIHCASRR